MKLEALRIHYAHPVESIRRIPPRMSTESVTDRRIRLVRDLLDNGEGIERIDAEPESPPANSKVVATVTSCLDRIAEADIPLREKALRVGALVRIAWMESDSLAEIRDQLPGEVWAAAAQVHEFGETRHEREKFIEMLSQDAAMELKIQGVPPKAIEAWNYHYLRHGAQHLLVDVGTSFRWQNIDRLVPFFGAEDANWSMAWLKENGAHGGIVLTHLLETDQATITSPDRIKPMLAMCTTGDNLVTVIEKWDALDPTRIPACAKQWYQEVQMLQTAARAAAVH